MGNSPLTARLRLRHPPRTGIAPESTSSGSPSAAVDLPRPLFDPISTYWYLSGKPELLSLGRRPSSPPGFMGNLPMSSLAPILEAFFTERLLTHHRQVSAHTVCRLSGHSSGCCSCFAQRRHSARRPASAGPLADLDAPLIAVFLDHLEQRATQQRADPQRPPRRGCTRCSATPWLRDTGQRRCSSNVCSPFPRSAFEMGGGRLLPHPPDEVEALLAAPDQYDLDRPARPCPVAWSCYSRPGCGSPS